MSLSSGTYTVTNDYPLTITCANVTPSSIITISPIEEMGVNSGTSAVVLINNGSFLVESSMGDRSKYYYFVEMKLHCKPPNFQPFE